jgi:hypothetical protein
MDLGSVQQADGLGNSVAIGNRARRAERYGQKNYGYAPAGPELLRRNNRTTNKVKADDSNY